MKNLDNLQRAFLKMHETLKDIKVINLSSVDGFPIHTHFFENKNATDEDKLAAVASSITALSLSASKELIGSNFESTSIETKNGNMILLATKFNGKNCLLCFVTGNHHKIGEVRYFAFKLSNHIKNSLNVN